MGATLTDEHRRRAEESADRAVDLALARAEPYAFRTYQCASRLPRNLADADASLAAVFREAVRRRMRERLAEAWPDRSPEGERPEVVLEAIPDQLGLAFRVLPVRVAGRYRKLARGISQTVFHCRTCRGRRARACDECGGTGRLFPESVEDHVCPPIERALGGRRSAFQGAGREDVDVRMLGAGRPFVVSVERPRRREIDAAALEAAVEESSGGRVVVHGLRIVDKAEQRAITTYRGRKRYRAVLAAAGPLPEDWRARLGELGGAELRQRTPQRVEGRRADLVRTRRVLELDVEERVESRVTLTLLTEAGTYVKEFVSGDAGRTEPSCAAALGVPCVCVELDVLSAGG